MPTRERYVEMAVLEEELTDVLGLDDTEKITSVSLGEFGRKNGLRFTITDE